MMRIAEISNIREAVPPHQYGGAEYVISLVTEGLAGKKHNMTLFATGDSASAAHLESIWDTSLGYQNANEDMVRFLTIRHLANILQKADSFDILHNHILETFALAPYLHVPIITTLHTDLSRSAEQTILTQPGLEKTFFISISDSQRRSLPHLPYVRTIYHGIPIGEFPFNEQAGDYLVFLGRITPEKGLEVAIEVAERTGLKLIVAAKVDEPPSEYARAMLKRMENSPQVEFIGQVGAEKKELLANARALLMPIQWDEPFGLVVIEALATGTPVVAFNRGSMPEIIEEGKTGFLVTTTDEMVATVKNISTLDRRACRRSVEKRFSVDRMVSDYEKVFEEIMQQSK